MLLAFFESLFAYDEDPWVYVYAMHFMTGVSIFLFCLGVFCVWTKSTSITPSYRKLIVVYMIANIESQVCWTSFYLPRLMLPYPAGDTLGIFSMLGVSPKMQLTIQFSLICHLGGVTALMFAYRYFILLPTGHFMRNKALSWFLMIMLVVFSVVIPPPLFYWCTYGSDYEEIKQKLVKKFGLISPSLYHKDTLAFELSPGSPLFITFVYLSICMVFMASSIIFCMIKIATFFKKFSTFMSPSTRRQHTSLTRMLYVQTAVSFGLISLPFSVFILFLMFEIGACGILHICFVIYACADPATTVIMIVMHGPYKKAVFELLYRLGIISTIPSTLGVRTIHATSSSSNSTQKRRSLAFVTTGV